MAKRKSSRKKRQAIRLKMRADTSYSVIAVLLIMLGGLVLLSFTGQGQWLMTINNFLTQKIGISMLFLPFLFIASGLVMIRSKHAWSKPTILLGVILMMIGAMGVSRSGEIGINIFDNLARLITSAGSYMVFGALTLIGFLVLSQSSLTDLVNGITKFFAKRQALKSAKKGDKTIDKDVTDQEIKKSRHFSIPNLSFGKKDLQKGSDYQEELEIDQTTGTAVLAEKQVLTEKAPAGNLEGEEALNASSTPMIWDYPPLSLLTAEKGAVADRGDVKANAQIIENTLDSFGINAKVAEYNPGPAITQYCLNITQGTRLSKITALSTDLALALAAPTGQIRIEAPIPGRNLVGVEVPNHSAEIVPLKTVLSSPILKKHPSKLAVGLGVDVAGKPVVADIAEMPHLLIAGATGSGKSVCVNSFLCSILFRATPEEVKFILVDPKQVELKNYEDIPHLLTPVINNPDKVVSALKWAVELMQKRYKLLKEVGVRTIHDYNELAGLATMPNIVIVIDEMADIMLFAPKEVEDNVTRIAQMARAVGIHLVLATQRPSVDVITGLIKANMPTRIAFNVSSVTDSRVILDTPGAEKLLGKGDMLYLSPDRAKPARIQGTFVTSQEINQLMDHLKSQGKKPQYEEEITSKYQVSKVGGSVSVSVEGEADRDVLFDEAVRLFSKSNSASSSAIQRHLSVGYARAARILDQLEGAGFVGQAQGSKPREVFRTKMQEHLAAKDLM